MGLFNSLTSDSRRTLSGKMKGCRFDSILDAVKHFAYLIPDGINFSHQDLIDVFSAVNLDTRGLADILVQLSRKGNFLVPTQQQHLSGFSDMQRHAFHIEALSRQRYEDSLAPQKPSGEEEVIDTSTGLAVFISHSTQDSEIAEAVCEVLTKALALSSDRVRCTSVAGHRLPPGAHVDDQLKQEIIEATAFIGIITDVSIESAYVLFELGARWGAKRHLAPLLASGADSAMLKGPLSAFHAASCDDAAGIHELIESIAEVVGKPRGSPAGYQKQLDALLRASNEARAQREDKRSA